MYRSKNINKITGLTRTQINDYSDVIKPVRYETEGGYKVYDEDGLEKFKIVAICKKYKVKRKNIKEYIKNNYTLEEILRVQLDYLEKDVREKRRIIREIRKEFNKNKIRSSS